MKSFIIVFALLFFGMQCLNIYCQANSNQFEVIISGNGEQSIIFIPGFASSGEVWNDTKSQFEKNFKCYTLTMAGFAGIKASQNSTFKNWEDAIAKFITDNKINKPIIIGHSMGGGLALAIASDYPNLIDKIVVVDALPCLSALMNPTFKSKDVNDCSAIVQNISIMNDSQFYTMQKGSIGRLLEDSTKHELVIRWSMKSDRKTFAEMFCDFSNTDLREKIKNIKCPSLILLESNFKNLIFAINQQYSNLKNAKFEYANKGLHFIMYDDKEWYMNQLNNFLNSK